MSWIIQQLLPFGLRMIENFLQNKQASDDAKQKFLDFVNVLQGYGVRYSVEASQFKKQNPATDPQPPVEP